MSEAIKHYTNEFRSRRDLAPHHAEVLLNDLIAETNEDMLAELLTAWAVKGATQDELYRFASLMRSRMKRVETNDIECVDIVGTGGSSAKTFNVSTAVAFVVAGSGAPVAKHGNRAATSSSGSSDVLTQLGIDVDIEPAKAQESLERNGICFMFAPRHHSLSPTLAAARKRVAQPTIFNCIGPLCNPATAPHQLIGVWDASLVSKMANVLRMLGTKRSWIVHGEAGLDEIALTGKTRIAEVTADGIREFSISADEAGLKDDEPSRISNAEESAALIERVLKSKVPDSADESIVILNAAAALVIAGRAADLKAAADIARESIRSGAAFDKLKAMRRSR